MAKEMKELEDALMCKLCWLDVIEDPVSLRCSHHVCKACARHSAKPELRRECVVWTVTCPTCSQVNELEWRDGVEKALVEEAKTWYEVKKLAEVEERVWLEVSTTAHEAMSEYEKRKASGKKKKGDPKAAVVYGMVKLKLAECANVEEQDALRGEWMKLAEAYEYKNLCISVQKALEVAKATTPAPEAPEAPEAGPGEEEACRHVCVRQLSREVRLDNLTGACQPVLEEGCEIESAFIRKGGLTSTAFFHFSEPVAMSGLRRIFNKNFGIGSAAPAVEARDPKLNDRSAKLRVVNLPKLSQDLTPSALAQRLAAVVGTSSAGIIVDERFSERASEYSSPTAIVDMGRDIEAAEAALDKINAEAPVLCGSHIFCCFAAPRRNLGATDVITRDEIEAVDSSEAARGRELEAKMRQVYFETYSGLLAEFEADGELELAESSRANRLKFDAIYDEYPEIYDVLINQAARALDREHARRDSPSRRRGRRADDSDDSDDSRERGLRRRRGLRRSRRRRDRTDDDSDSDCDDSPDRRRRRDRDRFAPPRRRRDSRSDSDDDRRRDRRRRQRPRDSSPSPSRNGPRRHRGRDDRLSRERYALRP